jgi:hypothetical protein
VKALVIGAHGVLQLDAFGYVENLAHAVLLAADWTDAAAGRRAREMLGAVTFERMPGYTGGYSTDD